MWPTCQFIDNYCENIIICVDRFMLGLTNISLKAGFDNSNFNVISFYRFYFWCYFFKNGDINRTIWYSWDNKDVFMKWCVSLFPINARARGALSRAVHFNKTLPCKKNIFNSRLALFCTALYIFRWLYHLKQMTVKFCLTLGPCVCPSILAEKLPADTAFIVMCHIHSFAHTSMLMKLIPLRWRCMVSVPHHTLLANSEQAAFFP